MKYKKYLIIIFVLFLSFGGGYYLGNKLKKCPQANLTTNDNATYLLEQNYISFDCSNNKYNYSYIDSSLSQRIRTNGSIKKINKYIYYFTDGELKEKYGFLREKNLYILNQDNTIIEYVYETDQIYV